MKVRALFKCCCYKPRKKRYKNSLYKHIDCMGYSVKNYQLEEFKKLIESGNIGMIEEMQDVMKGGNK